MKKNKKTKVDFGSGNLDELYKALKLLIIVLVIFGIFYLLTAYIINKDNKKDNSSKDEVEIQYKEILAGSSFSIDDNEYYVLYYDKSNEELKSDIDLLISEYETKEDKINIYTVDMSNSFNKHVVSDSSNMGPTSASELKINGTTLIKFSDKKVVDYIENYDMIKEYLN